MGFRYEDAASQWWEGWPLSAQASSSNSLEMKRLTNEVHGRVLIGYENFLLYLIRQPVTRNAF
jgi:hypothetical protein